MKLHVEWMESGWALCKANGHVFAYLAQKGDNGNLRQRAKELADAYNAIYGNNTWLARARARANFGGELNETQ